MAITDKHIEPIEFELKDSCREYYRVVATPTTEIFPYDDEPDRAETIWEITITKLWTSNQFKVEFSMTLDSGQVPAPSNMAGHLSHEIFPYLILALARHKGGPHETNHEQPL